MNIDIELKDQTLNFTVSPVHAAIIMQFQQQGNKSNLFSDILVFNQVDVVGFQSQFLCCLALIFQHSRMCQCAVIKLQDFFFIFIN